jgi:hypothetical protein
MVLHSWTDKPQADIDRFPSDTGLCLSREERYLRYGKRWSIGRESTYAKVYSAAYALQKIMHGDLRKMEHHNDPKCKSVCQHADYEYVIDFTKGQFLYPVKAGHSTLPKIPRLNCQNNYRETIDCWKRLFSKQTRLSKRKQKLSIQMTDLASDLEDFFTTGQSRLETIEAALQTTEQGYCDESEASKHNPRQSAQDVLSMLEDAARQNERKVTSYIEENKVEIAKLWDASERGDLWRKAKRLQPHQQGLLLGAMNPRQAAELLLQMEPYPRWLCLCILDQEQRMGVVNHFGISDGSRILDQIDRIQRMEATERTVLVETFLWTPGSNSISGWELEYCAGCKTLYEAWDGFTLCECETKTFHMSCVWKGCETCADCGNHGDDNAVSDGSR